MPQLLWVLGLVFAAGTAHADDISTLPLGTVFTLKKDIEFAARLEKAWVISADDGDEDGVPNYDDWCPNTSAGTKVVTESEINEKKAEKTQHGCPFGTPGDDWLWDPNDLESHPSGDVFHCSLTAPKSEKARVLKATKTLEVKKVTNATSTEFGLADFSTEFELQTTGGTALQMSCRSSHHHRPGSQEQRDYLYKKYGIFNYNQSFPVDKLRMLFDVTIPPPEEIP